MLVTLKRRFRATTQWLSVRWAWLHRKIYPGAPSAKLLYGLLAAAIGVLVGVIVAGYWSKLNGVCSDGHRADVTCGISIHIVGTILFGLLVFYLFFLRREARAAAAWRFGAKHEPLALFPWLPPPSDPPAADGKGWAARMRARRKRWLFWVMTGAGPTGWVEPPMVLRELLVSEIVRDIDDGAEPQILVGTTGTGKSLTLVELAGYLAKRGQVPIAVTARGHKNLDFEKLARDAYRRNVSARRAHDREKQWTWLRQRRLVTILVDELEQSEAQPHERAAALELAQRHGLRLVAASRPDGLPTDFKQGRVQLESLEEDAVTAHLTERLSQGQERSGRELKRDPQELARDWVGAAGMATTPYYLALAGPLADICCLQPPPRIPYPRYKLLTAYRAALEQAKLKPDAGLSPPTRKQVVAGLEEVGYHQLLGQCTEQEILDDRPDRRWNGGLDLHAIIDGGRRLGLLNSRFDEAIRFAHPTMLAYLASRHMRKHAVDGEAWRKLFDGVDVTPVMTRAMLFANADKPDPTRVRLTCEKLLERVRRDRAQPESLNGGGSANGPVAPEVAAVAPAAASPAAGAGATDPVVTVPRPVLASPAVPSNGANAATADGAKHRRPASAAEHERLSLLAAAAEILSLAPAADDSTLTEIVAQAREERVARGELAIATQRVVRAIGRVGARTASEALWGYATGSDIYAVRREAIKALADGQGAGIPTATELVADAVEQALHDHPKLETGAAAVGDDRKQPFPTLKAAAWVLPRLRTESRGQTRERLEGLEARLLTIAQKAKHRGMEASIAQGLKLDAMAQPHEPIDPTALEMLGDHDCGNGARFWFSRVLAIQAVARRAVETETPDTVRNLLQKAKHETEHPFVRQAATLGLRAIDRRSWTPYIWNDMTDIASRTPRRLELVATQLIGDMVLVLNLNEHGLPRQRQGFGEARELPVCLHQSRDRGEILGLRPTTSKCPFWHNGGAVGSARCLCPYTYEYVQSAPAYRELSRSFCRHQRLNAQPLPWQPELKTPALKEFWRTMESLARF